MRAGKKQKVSWLRLGVLRMCLAVFILAVVAAPVNATSMYFQAHQPHSAAAGLWDECGDTADAIAGQQCLSHFACSMTGVLPAAPAVPPHRDTARAPLAVQSPADRCAGGLFHPPRPIA